MRRSTFKRHAPYCSCKECGPVDKWAVYDGKRVYTVDSISRAEIERRQKAKQLKDGRYWLKWEEVPQIHKEAYLGSGRVNVDIFTAFVADCPFCGSAGFLTYESRPSSQPGHGSLVLYFVVCTNHECACALKPCWDPKIALQNWNRRVIALRAVVINSAAAASGA